MDKQELKNRIGNALVVRLVGYVDEAKELPGLVAEISEQMAGAYIRAEQATTAEKVGWAEQDLDFLEARVTSWIARHTLRFRKESLELAKEVLETATIFLVEIARALLESRK